MINSQREYTQNVITSKTYENHKILSNKPNKWELTVSRERRHMDIIINKAN